MGSPQESASRANDESTPKLAMRAEAYPPLLAWPFGIYRAGQLQANTNDFGGHWHEDARWAWRMQIAHPFYACWLGPYASLHRLILISFWCLLIYAESPGLIDANTRAVNCVALRQQGRTLSRLLSCPLLLRSLPAHRHSIRINLSLARPKLTRLNSLSWH